MGLEFVCGRVTAKVEDYFASLIDAQTKDDPLKSIVVLVPPQATYHTELFLMDTLGRDGIMGVSVMSPVKIADRVLSEVYGAKLESIDGAGKSMILKRILNRELGQLSALRSSVQKSNIQEALSGFIAELKTMDILPETLRSIDFGNDNSRAKMADVAHVYEAFLAESEGLFDNEDRMNLVIEHIKNAPFIKNAHVIVHGFDVVNTQTARFIKEIMHTARHATMTFPYSEAGEPDADVYDICRETYEKFTAELNRPDAKRTVIRETQQKSPDVLHIGRMLYAYPATAQGGAKDVSITYAADMEAEIRAVCTQMVYLNQKSGYAYSDMALVCGDISSYGKTLRKICRKMNIPFYIAEKRMLDKSPAAAFVLSTLELMQGNLKKHAVMSHIKLGFYGLSPEDMGLLQNYAYENISSGFAFLKPFFSDAAEAVRSAVAEKLLALREAAKNAATAEEYIDVLLNYMERLALREQLDERIATMHAAGFSENAEFTQTSCDRVLGILLQAKEIFAGRQMERMELSDLLAAAFSSGGVTVIPPGAQEVAMGDIANMRLPRIKALFVVGANEGILPNYSETSDILAPHEREVLYTAMGVRHTGNIARQRLAILKAFSRPERKLFLSCIQDGKSVPSPLVDRIKRLFSGNVRENRAEALSIMLYENALDLAGEYLRNEKSGKALTAAQQKLVSSVFESREDDGRRAHILRAVNEKNTTRTLDNATAISLYGNISGTASRIEAFFGCPYKHFIKYGVRPTLPREHTIGQLDIGNYIHGVLDGLFREIKEAGTAIGAASDAALSDMLQTSRQNVLSRQGKFALDKRNEAVLSALDEEIGLAVSAIQKQSAAGAMQVAETEYRFYESFPGGVEISGVIDRVDTAEIDGKRYFDIVDYKSGAAEFSIRKAFGGLNIQLIIYIMAAQKIWENAEFAGAFYFRVKMPELSALPDLEKEYKMKGIVAAPPEAARALYGDAEGGPYSLMLKITKSGSYNMQQKNQVYAAEDIEILTGHVNRLIKNAVQEIHGGNIDIFPAGLKKEDDIACQYCDYKSICLFDEVYPGNEKRLVEEMDKQTALRRMAELSENNDL
ncbi:MAG: PD-(D/E)XK nuclease family protein [Christensenellaceae bacterium]